MFALLIAIIKVSPSFVNQYYAECISQNLAPVCYRLEIPSLLEFLGYLFQ
jgi:hypothetical protein